MLLAFWLGTEREGLGGELVGVLNILNIWRRAVIGALACLALIAPQASAAPAQTSPDLRRLVQQVQRSRDGVDARVFDEIVSEGGEEALKALCRSIRSLREETLLDAACRALRGFRADPDLCELSLDYLADEARGHPRFQNRRSAIRGLVAFGPVGHPHLLELLRDTSRADLLALAIAPVVALLGDEGTPRAARLLIDHAPVETRSERRRLVQALNRFSSAEFAEALGVAILRETVPGERRVVLLGVFGARPMQNPHLFLVRVLKSRDPLVRTKALQLLRLTTVRGLAPRLRRSLGSHHEPEVRAAILALGRLGRWDDACRKELLSLAEEGREELCPYLPEALAQDGGDAALDLLCAMVADRDTAVRRGAVDELELLRCKDSIPLLIERLDQEDHTATQRVAQVLRLITGCDHGLTSQRWMRWWSAEGDVFSLPTVEVAMASERVRREREASNPTQARGFYGIAVLSDRVAFVIDKSGSMDAPASVPGRTRVRGSAGLTRLDVAKQQLSDAIEGLVPGARFNVLFFDSGVASWRAGLAEKTPRSVRQALGFVKSPQAAGGTNLHDALVEALRNERVDTVYLLSDGDPSAGSIVDASAIRESIRRVNRRRKVRIHCISIGQDSALLRALAKEHGGEYKRAG